MSNPLYMALGIGEYDLLEVHEDQNELLVLIGWRRETWRCPDCGSAEVHGHGRQTRFWRTVPIGLKQTRLAMDVPRIKCLDCGQVRVLKPTMAVDMRRHTNAFERYAGEMLRYVTPTDLSRHLGISWETANGIDMRRLEALPRPKLSQLKYIAVDEIYSGKQHKFLTIVLDLQTSVVVYVGDGRGAEALRPFFERLRQSKAKLEAISMDMSGGYKKAVREHLPKVPVIFDRFHVIKLMNEKLSDLRRELAREATEKLQLKVLKGIRWLLLMGEETLDSPLRKSRRKPDATSDRARLDAALILNKPLATAYYLKEKLRLFWAQGTKAAADKCLDSWLKQAETSGIRVLMTMAKTLREHRAGLLAWYDHPISTGPLEGINNKIKLIQHRAYGYRNAEHFKLRILNLHHTRHTLIG